MKLIFEEEDIITQEEINKAIQYVKNRKEATPNKIANECLGILELNKQTLTELIINWRLTTREKKTHFHLNKRKVFRNKLTVYLYHWIKYSTISAITKTRMFDGSQESVHQSSNK